MSTKIVPYYAPVVESRPVMPDDGRVKKVCKTCGIEFMGTRTQKHCSDHSYRIKTTGKG
jgi:hypothetical protein